MKKKTAIFLFFIFVLSQNLSFSQIQISAGAAKVNITPPIGTVINGDFLPLYAQTINDSLYAKALAFDNGKKRFVFVVVDNMTLDGALINDTKALIKKKLGLPPSQVMISATHAHSCGSVIGFGLVSIDLNYRLAMPNKIYESVKLALQKLQPAKIAWGSFDLAKYTSCRRWYMKPGFKIENPFGEKESVWMNPTPGSEFLDKPVSPTDPQVNFIAVKSMKDEWISIMANYSIHYAADVPENTISADYFGEVGKQLAEKLGAEKDFVGIMSNGTSGDVNTTDFRLERNYPKEPLGKSKLIANDVTDLIINNLKSCTYNSKPIFNFNYKDLLLTSRLPDAGLLEKSKKKVANLNFSSLNSIDKASSSISNMYAIEIVGLGEYQSKNVLAPIQAVRLGDGTIGTLPGEIFAETGLKLKKGAHSKYYFTVCLANCQIGYVPPAEQMKLGGYETWLCSGSHMEAGAEEKLRLTLAEMIKALK
jgi:neutral ceramidase